MHIVLALIAVWLILCLFGEAIQGTLSRSGWQYICFFVAFCFLMPALVLVFVPVYLLAQHVERVSTKSKTLTEGLPDRGAEVLEAVTPKDELPRSSRRRSSYNRRHN